MNAGRRRWLLAAVAALMAAWVAAPAAVPVYDGLQNPDEPYRYVDPPAGARQTGPPTKAVATLKVAHGVTGAAYVNSGESGPQISIYLPAGAIRPPAGARAVTVTATPLAPAPPLPRDGTIWTNVYRVAATSNGQSLQVVGSGAKAPTIQMRAPSARQPAPVFEHRTASGWEQTTTLRVGNDVYQTQAPAFGDWALVRLTHPEKAGPDSGGGVNAGLLGAGVAVLVVAGLILAIRVARTRRPTA